MSRDSIYLIQFFILYLLRLHSILLQNKIRTQNHLVLLFFFLPFLCWCWIFLLASFPYSPMLASLNRLEAESAINSTKYTAFEFARIVYWVGRARKGRWERQREKVEKHPANAPSIMSESILFWTIVKTMQWVKRNSIASFGRFIFDSLLRSQCESILIFHSKSDWKTIRSAWVYAEHIVMCGW